MDSHMGLVASNAASGVRCVLFAPSVYQRCIRRPIEAARIDSAE
ncbi:hypothetical protein OK016_29910 [Vibrio chagasii]|nr:hypothetical protein [Vibrio chagasii]